MRAEQTTTTAAETAVKAERTSATVTQSVAQAEQTTSTTARTAAKASGAAGPATRAPSVGGGATSEPGVQPSTAPKIGSITEDRVTVDYDMTDPAARGSMTVRRINVADFPPDRPGPVLRFFNDHPVVEGLSHAGASAAAGYVSGAMVDEVQKHFEGALDKAAIDFERAYPSADALFLDADLYDKEETFDAIMDQFSETTYVLGHMNKPEEFESNLEGAFAYESALMSLQEKLADRTRQLPAIYDDIDRRASVLLGIAFDLESAFTWIHTHVIGGFLPVYYQSFILWQTRTVFNDLGHAMSAFAGTIRRREIEYNELYAKLDKKLDRATPLLNPWRTFYRQNKQLLGRPK